MSRSTPEWIGASDDTAIPPRVRLRVWERDDGRCQCGCNRKINVGERWEADHTIALVNGGENRESNLRVILAAHHKVKTAADVAEKAKVRRAKAKQLGIRKPSWRPMPGSRKSPWRHKINGQWERRT